MGIRKNLKIIDKNESRDVTIEFYNTIFSAEKNHWDRIMFRDFDKLFVEIILGNYRSYMKSFLEIGCGDGRFFDAAIEKLKKLRSIIFYWLKKSSTFIGLLCSLT